MANKKNKQSVVPTAVLLPCCGQKPTVREDKRTGDTIVACESCGTSIQVFGRNRATTLFNHKASICSRIRSRKKGV